MSEPVGSAKDGDSRVTEARRAFPRARMELIGTTEAGHFWFAPREELLAQTLGRHRPPPAAVLDVGCGTGRWLQRLQRDGYDGLGADIWPEPPVAMRGDNYRIGRAEALPWETGRCDAVTLLDTLEHVDDVQALREAWRVLRPGGIVLVSVPAFPGLWSERDRKAGHRRRYTRASLAAVVRAGGFESVALFGYQMALLPLIWWSRRRARSQPDQLNAEEFPSPWLNRVLRAINRTEVALGCGCRPPIGSSLILVARKASI
jgi:SAM-dependent methyltransferase